MLSKHRFDSNHNPHPIMKRLAFVIILLAVLVVGVKTSESCGPCAYDLFSLGHIPYDHLPPTSMDALYEMDEISVLKSSDTVVLATGDSIDILAELYWDCDWLTAPSNIEFRWYRNGLPIYAGPNNSWRSVYTIKTTGSYEITHRIKSGMVKYSFEVVEPSEPVLSESLEVNVYPNPISDVIQLKLAVQNPGDIQYYIIDMNGTVVFSQKEYLEGGTLSTSINMTNLSSGNYQLIVESPEGKKTKAIVKI